MLINQKKEIVSYICLEVSDFCPEFKDKNLAEERKQ